MWSCSSSISSSGLLSLCERAKAQTRDQTLVLALDLKCLELLQNIIISQCVRDKPCESAVFCINMYLYFTLLLITNTNYFHLFIYLFILFYFDQLINQLINSPSRVYFCIVGMYERAEFLFVYNGFLYFYFCSK